MPMDGNAQTNRTNRIPVNRISGEQVRELLIRAAAALPIEMSSEAAQFLIQKPGMVGDAVQKALGPLIKVGEELGSWQMFYRHAFGNFADFLGMKLPEMVPGIGFLIVVARGFTPNILLSAFARFGLPYESYTDDLDRALDIGLEGRGKEFAYAVWVRDKAKESPEVIERLSAADLRKQAATHLTLTERLLLELKAFLETGKFSGYPIPTCGGSRTKEGDIPLVYVRDGKLRVGLHAPPRVREDHRKQ